MAAATLFVLPIIACGGNGEPPPPTGAIAGQVSIEGMGIDGVSGSSRIESEKATDVVTHALTTAGPPPAPRSEPAIPTWDYHTSTATVGAADFVLLYKDGEIAGRVVDLSERDGHARAVVELHQCKTFTPFDDAGTPTDGTDDRAADCTEYTGVVEEAAVGSEGNWSKGDLREGVYEVVVDLPAGYQHVNKSGVAESDADLTAVPVVPESYFTHQFAELVGRRAAALTETFYIALPTPTDSRHAAEAAHAMSTPRGADGETRNRRAGGRDPAWSPRAVPVPDPSRHSLYRVRVIQVAGEDYGLRDTGEYRAVLRY